MSIAYLIAFDNELVKTKYYYTDILQSKKNVFSNQDGILFDINLLPQEKQIADKLMQGRVVYSIRSSVPLERNQRDSECVDEKYYLCEKEQLCWLKNFLCEHIADDEDCLFVQTSLGHPINYAEILSQQVDVKSILITDDFAFEPNLIYQFVNN